MLETTIAYVVVIAELVTIEVVCVFKVCLRRE